MPEPVSARTLYLTYGALMLMLLATLGSSYLALGPLNVVLNVGFAFAKALLIMAVFMHLGAASTAVRIAAATGFAFLAVMIALTLVDYAQRWL